MKQLIGNIKNEIHMILRIIYFSFEVADLSVRTV